MLKTTNFTQKYVNYGKLQQNYVIYSYFKLLR